MPSVTYDGRSFMIDGRRIWIMSATIPFSRIPRSSWADRIHAAKLAGMNTIEAPVVWGRCEPRAGQFDFEGQNDLRHFVELVGKAGMWSVLRVGPYIDEGWDLGGIPSWLLTNPDISLRSSNQPFLEACSRFIGQFAQRVKDLQVTSAGKGGPVLLVQVEMLWTCSDSDQGQPYLGELNRYLRESGITVPTINANNLWQGVESEIDCWVGDAEMLATMRQLGAVLPDQPRYVAQFGPRAPGRFGREAPADPDPRVVQRSMAEVLAAGGQVNLSPFAAGQTPGFWSGRLIGSDGAFLTPTNDLHAPIDVLGRATPRYHAVRQLATFATHFGRVFANLDPETAPVVLDPTHPGESKPGKGDFGPTIVHRRGPQGSVCLIFSQETSNSGKSRGSINLLLRDGSVLPVDLSSNLVHWCLFDAHLAGRAMLTYSSLCVLGMTGRTLVVFGGAGTIGHIAINGSPLEVEVPTNKTPLVITHEHVHVVVCNDQTINETFIGQDAVFVGVQGLDAGGEPFGTGRYIRISNDGAQTTHSLSSRRGKSEKIEVGTWECAPAEDHANGTNPRYATIPGPATLPELGSPYGYGWYRIQLKLGAGKRSKVMAPRSEDRFQVIVDGEPAGVMGEGPGAEPQLSLSLKKGDRTIVVLADNMGHVCEGSNFDRHKGLRDQLYEVSPMKIGKPKLSEGEPLSPISFRSPLFGVRDDDQTHPLRVCWTAAHRRKSPLFVEIKESPARGLLVVNGEAKRYFDLGEAGTVVLGDEDLKRGNNVIEFAVIHEFGDEEEVERDLKAVADHLASSLTIWEGVNELTGKGTWAFAKWEQPMDSMFAPVTKSGGDKPSGPAWWRTTLSDVTPGDAVRLILTGMTKGQVFLNGEHVARYFVATADGTPVPPMDSVVLHASSFAEGENELVLFDEHGGNPTKCRFVVETPDDVIRAQA